MLRILSECKLWATKREEIFWSDEEFEAVEVLKGVCVLHTVCRQKKMFNKIRKELGGDKARWWKSRFPGEVMKSV